MGSSNSRRSRTMSTSSETETEVLGAQGGSDYPSARAAEYPSPRGIDCPPPRGAGGSDCPAPSRGANSSTRTGVEEDQHDLQAILAYLIRSGQVRIVTQHEEGDDEGEYSDDYEFCSSASKPPRPDDDPDTSRIDREIGRRGNQQFTCSDRRAISCQANDGCLYIYDRHEDKRTLKGDARYLLSNSKDQTMKLWDIRMFSSQLYDLLTGEIVTKLTGHKQCVRDVSWHPYENTLVSTSGLSHIPNTILYNSPLQLGFKSYSKYNPLQLTTTVRIQVIIQIQSSTNDHYSRGLSQTPNTILYNSPLQLGFKSYSKYNPLQLTTTVRVQFPTPNTIIYNSLLQSGFKSYSKYNPLQLTTTDRVQVLFQIQCSTTHHYSQGSSLLPNAVLYNSPLQTGFKSSSKCNPLQLTTTDRVQVFFQMQSSTTHHFNQGSSLLPNAIIYNSPLQSGFKSSSKCNPLQLNYRQGSSLLPNAILYNSPLH
ncbi:DCAF11 [Mytilus edulis]|uniref:DCAF11 n=1 Tax=Mytilus edulis TaxID=6550 RepID=A0A8S3UXV8_MYTED|nr:DCAF11 [Mytilus edulis]